MLPFDQLLSALDSLEQMAPERRAPYETELLDAVAAEPERLLELLRALPPSASPSSDRLLQRVLARLPVALAASLDEQTITEVADLYRRLDKSDAGRACLLRLLAADGGRRALQTFAELVTTEPIEREQLAALAFVPLFQHPSGSARDLFPRLFDSLEHPALAGMVLDLANFLFRKGLARPHPAADRVVQLAGLLQALVRRLSRIEEQPGQFATTPQQLNRIVGESVGLVVSLCDAVALVGNAEVTSKLYEALELRHRRVRTEAAAALLRLGDQAGLEPLVAMTAEPVVRTRALGYLQELGMLDRVPANRASPAARAEGELAAWLAEPAHFGLPPSGLELVDARRQHWPGFEHEVDCYLFRFEYRVGEQSVASVAMAGPLTHAFMCDLQDLPPDDIYAAYAGWFAEHPEVGETTADALSEADLAAWRSLLNEIAESGYQEPELVLRGDFFGRTQWVAKAMRHGLPGVLVVDEKQICWYPLPQARRPPGADVVYCIHKGRELLRAFNPGQ